MSTNRSFDNLDDDRYANFAAKFDPLESDRQARRKRKLKPDHRPKKTQQEILIEMVGDNFSLDLDGSFNVTYQPSRYEEGWLLNSLRSYFEQELMSDILAIVKGGKEATVYRCAPGMALPDEEFVAAKVYRPRQFRNLSNDKMY